MVPAPERRRRRWSARALAGAAVLGAGALSVLSASGQDLNRAQTRLLVEIEQGQLDRELVTDELQRAFTTEGLFRLLTTSESFRVDDDADVGPLTEDTLECVRDALRATPEETRRFLAEAYLSGTVERTAGLELFAFVATVEDLGYVVNLGTTGEPSGAVRRTLREALGAILAREEGAYDKLEQIVVEAAPPDQPLLIAGLTAASTGASAATLSRLLQDERVPNAFVIRAFGDLGERALTAVDDSTTAQLRWYLESIDTDHQREAALAVGKLGDHESLPLLVDLLDAEDAGVRANAAWSLRRISCRSQRSSDRWAQWYEREHDWWVAWYPAILERAHRGRTAVAVLSELGKVVYHPTFRHAITKDLVPFLQHDDPAVRAGVCPILVELGSAHGLAPLIEAFEGEADPAVQDTLARALERFVVR